MDCDYCYGQVKIVDNWTDDRGQERWTVECKSCGVRYDAYDDPKKLDKVNFNALMTQRWGY